MQTQPPQSSSDFAFTHAQRKNITEEEEMLNIISDSSDLSVSRLNTLWSLWHMQTHQQQSGQEKGVIGDGRKAPRLVHSIFLLKSFLHCFKDDFVFCVTFVSVFPQPPSSYGSLSSKAPFPLFTALVLSQSLSVIISLFLSPLSLFSKGWNQQVPLWRASKGERGWGRERERKQSRTERINDERGGRLSVCVRLCMCLGACLINAVSIRRREWEGGRGREKERVKTGYSYRQRQRLGRAREKQGRGGRRQELRQGKSFEDNTGTERQLGWSNAYIYQKEKWA